MLLANTDDTKEEMMALGMDDDASGSPGLTHEDGTDVTSPPDLFGDLPLEALLDLDLLPKEGAEAERNRNARPSLHAAAAAAPPKGEEDGAVQHKAKRREISRNYRARKKEGVEKLRKRSRELEQEQEDLRSRVIELRGEMEALRQNDLANLSMENELLRVEIKRHKAFISQVLTDALHKAPSDSSPEAQYRLVRNGLESGKAQLLALAYSAAMDPSWRVSPTVLKHRLHKDNIIAFQALPRGAPRKEATRFKTRFLETCQPPVRMDLLTHERLVRADTTTRPSPYVENCTHHVEDITPPAFAAISEQLGTDESIVIFRHREVFTPPDGGERVVRERVRAEVFGHAEVALHHVFPEYCDKYGIPPTFTTRAVLQCSSNFGNHAETDVRDALVSASQAEAATTDDHALHGTIYCANPMNEDEVFIVSLNSVPVREPIRPDLPHVPHSDTFDDDGVMHPKVVADCMAQYEAFIAAFETPGP